MTDARRAVDMLSDKRDFLFFLCVRVCDCDCCSLVGGLRVCWISIQCPSSNHKESVASLHLVWAPRSATTVTCGPAVGFTASIDSVNSNLWSYSFYPFLKCPRMARKDVSLADCVGVVVVFFFFDVIVCMQCVCERERDLITGIRVNVGCVKVQRHCQYTVKYPTAIIVKKGVIPHCIIKGVGSSVTNNDHGHKKVFLDSQKTSFAHNNNVNREITFYYFPIIQ